MASEGNLFDLDHYIHNFGPLQKPKCMTFFFSFTKCFFGSVFSPIQICWASNVLQLLFEGRGKSGEEGLTTLGPVPHRVRVNWLNTPERETKKCRGQKGDGGKYQVSSSQWENRENRLRRGCGGGRRRNKWCARGQTQLRRRIDTSRGRESTPISFLSAVLSKQSHGINFEILTLHYHKMDFELRKQTKCWKLKPFSEVFIKKLLDIFL